MKLLFLLWAVTGAMCYIPSGKESLLSGIFLRELVNRMNGKGLDGDISYLDLTDGLPLDGRSLTRDLEEEQMFPLDYENVGDIALIHPSIRDQEYLRHSSLWANQYAGVGSGDDANQILRHQSGLKNNKQEMKPESTLPAYCNPPNPCPVGYSEEQGCSTNFENTASFSRRYQAVQDCMCDSEHMFDCPNVNDNMVADDPMDSLDQMDFNRFLQQSLKLEAFPHKNMVAKKFHSNNEKSVKTNPFLRGEKLPVAAKKGTNAY